MATTINNPMGDVEFIEEPEGQVYMGKYGAAKGPGSKDVSVKTGDGDMDDAVEIVGADGEKVASIPYRELFTFCVITGDGNRKPAISFEHKPDEKAKSGFNHKVWMEAQAATKCADGLMQILKDLEAEGLGGEGD